MDIWTAAARNTSFLLDHNNSQVAVTFIWQAPDQFGDNVWNCTVMLAPVGCDWMLLPMKLASEQWTVSIEATLHKCRQLGDEIMKFTWNNG